MYLLDTVYHLYPTRSDIHNTRSDIHNTHTNSLTSSIRKIHLGICRYVKYQHFYSQFTFEYWLKTSNSLATVLTLAGTCPDIDFLKCAKNGEFIRDLAFLAWLSAFAWLLSAYLLLFAMLNDFMQNLHLANLGSPSSTTQSLYLSCTSHSSRNL